MAQVHEFHGTDPSCSTCGPHFPLTWIPEALPGVDGASQQALVEDAGVAGTAEDQQPSVYGPGWAHGEQLTTPRGQGPSQSICLLALCKSFFCFTQ